MDPIKEAMIRDDDGLSAGANTPLTPMGMARELVGRWHTVNFGLKIEAWKLEMLASRIAELVVANTLEAIRELEDYNGKHQRAVMVLDDLRNKAVQLLDECQPDDLAPSLGAIARLREAVERSSDGTRL